MGAQRPKKDDGALPNRTNPLQTPAAHTRPCRCRWKSVDTLCRLFCCPVWCPARRFLKSPIRKRQICLVENGCRQTAPATQKRLAPLRYTSPFLCCWGCLSVLQRTTKNRQVTFSLSLSLCLFVALVFFLHCSSVIMISIYIRVSRSTNIIRTKNKRKNLYLRVD